MRTVQIFVWMARLLAGALTLATGSFKLRLHAAHADRSAKARPEDDSDPRNPDDKRDASDDPEDAGPRSAAEWTVLSVSAIVVALLVGATLYEHYAQEEPPGIRIAVDLALDQAEQRDGLTYVPFTVRNTGRSPAENVVIRFEIKLGDDIVEESTAEFAFLPNSGSAEGEIVTARDLGTHTIEAQVSTVQIP